MGEKQLTENLSDDVSAKDSHDEYVENETDEEETTEEDDDDDDEGGYSLRRLPIWVKIILTVIVVVVCFLFIHEFHDERAIAKRLVFIFGGGAMYLLWGLR